MKLPLPGTAFDYQVGVFASLQQLNIACHKPGVMWIRHSGTCMPVLLPRRFVDALMPK